MPGSDGNKADLSPLIEWLAPAREITNVADYYCIPCWFPSCPGIMRNGKAWLQSFSRSLFCFAPYASNLLRNFSFSHNNWVVKNNVSLWIETTFTKPILPSVTCSIWGELFSEQRKFWWFVWGGFHFSDRNPAHASILFLVASPRKVLWSKNIKLFIYLSIIAQITRFFNEAEMSASG